MAATEHELRLARSNRHLIEELNYAGQRLALAERGMRMLETCCGDWGEALALVAAWRGTAENVEGNRPPACGRSC